MFTAKLEHYNLETLIKFFCTRYDSQDAEERAATKAANAAEEVGMAKSASDFSCQSYEMFVGNAPDRQHTTDDLANKEKMSIKSDSGDSINGDPRSKANGRVRKVCIYRSRS